MSKKVIFFLFIIYPSFIFSQQKETFYLTLEEALWLGYSRNDTLIFEERRKYLALKKRDRYYQKFLPNFSIYGSTSIQENLYIDNSNSYYSFIGTLGLKVGWDIFDYTLYTNWELVKAEATLSEIDQKIFNKKWEKDIKSSFLSLLLLKQKANYLKARIDALEGDYKQKRIEYEQGSLSFADLIKSQTEWELEQPSLGSLEVDILNSKKELSLKLNLPIDIFVDFLGDIESLLEDQERLIEEGNFLEREDLVFLNDSVLRTKGEEKISSIENLGKNIEYAPKLSLEMLMDYPFFSFQKNQYYPAWNLNYNKMLFKASLVLSWQISDYIWYGSWAQDKDAKRLKWQEAKFNYRNTTNSQLLLNETLLSSIDQKKREIEKRKILLRINDDRVREANFLFERGSISYYDFLESKKLREETFYELTKNQKELYELYQDLIFLY